MPSGGDAGECWAFFLSCGQVFLTSMAQYKFHEPVLPAEIIDLLVRRPGIYVDGTLGGGGHSQAILRAILEAGYGEGSLLIGIDQDDAALHEAAESLRGYDAMTVLVKGNFKGIEGLSLIHI